MPSIQPYISQTGHDTPLVCRIYRFSWILGIIWTLLVSASWSWNYFAEHKVFRRIAITEARTIIERDALYRRWAASHGGVYVPATPQSPPNPYLTHVAERDIHTPSDKLLTLINPAYMTRQVNELAASGNMNLGRGHITSLKPLRPENSPDLWEEKSLRAFELGVDEVSDITLGEGKSYMRLMRPFITQESCLKCHAAQGYTVGSVRGGISVTIPMQPLIDANREQITGSLVFHGIIWLLGISITGGGARQLSRSALVQKKTEAELHLQTVRLEEEIAERQRAQENLEELNRSLEERIKAAVAELRNRDQTLIQQGRLAAMGEMINNIAHQWRQPLNNIGLIIQSLQMSAKTGTITTKELEQEISKSMGIIMRMSQTIDDLRSFFRKDKQIGEFSISKTVRNAFDFVSAAMASNNIQMELSLDETVTTIGYQNEYTQVLLNLFSNARETAVERAIADPNIYVQVSRSGYNHSVVSIRDNCGGIADDIMPRIFDPYFTTRSPDKGTGIGLYMSKVIIEQNMSGSLTACNTGDGVEFRIEV